MEVNIHEAKTNLSRLIERVQMGDEVVIAKAGKPVARLVRIESSGKPIFGSAAGQIIFKEGWDAPMTDQELEEFLGEGPARHEHLPVVPRRRNAKAVASRRRRYRRSS